jgi:hypothetical protein
MMYAIACSQRLVTAAIDAIVRQKTLSASREEGLFIAKCLNS